MQPPMRSRPFVCSTISNFRDMMQQAENRPDVFFCGYRSPPPSQVQGNRGSRSSTKREASAKRIASSSLGAQPSTRSLTRCRLCPPSGRPRGGVSAQRAWHRSYREVRCLRSNSSEPAQFVRDECSSAARIVAVLPDSPLRKDVGCPPGPKPRPCRGECAQPGVGQKR